jgi:Electron transfer DM13
MTPRKLLIVAAAVAALAGAWYLFRPELLFVNKEVHEDLPFPARAGAQDARLKVLTTGAFHSVAHTTHGTATVHETADGKRVLRLTDFETSNGPAVRVYLIAAADADDADTVKKAETIDLGEMKGNKGDQNYDVPAGADLAKYRAVTIWCARFDVNFATAPLTVPAS